MNTRRRIIAVAVPLVAGGALVVAILAIQSSHARSASRSYAAAAGEPAITGVTTASGTNTDTVVGFTVAAPASATPALTAQQALDVVWPVEGAPGNPTSVTAEYGDITLPNLGVSSAPVWIFTYQPKSCIPRHGPGGGCIDANYHTIASSTTGAFIASYVERRADGSTD